jgi:Peptidase family M48
MKPARLLFGAILPLALLAPRGCLAAVPSNEKTTTDYHLASEALHDLVATPLGQTLPRLRWKVNVVQSWEVNAYSNGRGDIFITRGLAWVMGDHLGVWAAAIAHELGHGIMLYPAGQPNFEAELRKVYLASGGNLSDPAAERALRVTPAASGMFNLKGDRRGEYEADRLGLLLMAEAGFHPDFSVALDRVMRSALGDETKYSEFLLSHPLWSEREHATERAEGIALAIFNHAWPEAAHSPGGEAPPIGKIQSVTVSQDAQGRGVRLQIRFALRNAGTRPARIAAVLLNKNRKVRAARAEYRAPDGSLSLNVPLTNLANGQSEATMLIPYDAMAWRPKKPVVALFLVAGDWTDDLWFQPINLQRQR